MPQAEKIVQLPKAQMRAALVSNSFNAEKRTVDVVWSTGSRGARFDWDIGRYYEELSLAPEHVDLVRLNAGASVLNSHQSYDLSSVIGAIVPGSATVDGKEGRATVLFSEREDVAPFAKDVEAGIIRHISVGYNVTKYEHVDNVEEDGKMIPVFRATAWEPAEISFVPIAFDAGAQVRAGENDALKCIFINRSAAAEIGGVMTKEELEAKAAADAQAETKRQADLKTATEAGAVAERQRQADIRSAVRALPEADRATVEGELLADTAMTADSARAAVLSKLTAGQTEIRNANTVIVTVEDARDKFVRGATDWLIQRANVGAMIGDAGKNLQPGEFRGLKLQDLARDALENAGVKTRGLSQMEMIGKALTHRSGMNGTSDFAVLLENVMHKILQGAFAVTPDTWTRFCSRGSVSDFRAHNRYMLGSFGSLDSLNEHGEFKNKQIPDGAKESITAATKGNIIGISRQAIINDDMNAFASLAAMFGRAAKLSIEKDVYTLLALNSGLGPVMADGKTLFHADHGNIGTGSALTVLGLDADAVLMALQTDLSGNEVLDLSPSKLLVPKTLGSTAKILNQAQYDPDTANKLQKPNVVAGMFDDIIDTARLSGTRRYLFADSSVAPTVEVAFLDGQSEPVLETQDGWRVDGTEMKVRIDYAVAGVGTKGAVTNAGV